MLAIETYEVLKFFHVLFAIIAVGFNASYGIWLARAARERDHEAFALRGVKLLDDRFANPAYGLLLVTGLLMVWVGDLDLTQFWLLTALVLYAVAVGLGLFVYTRPCGIRSACSRPPGPTRPSSRRCPNGGRPWGSCSRSTSS